jgi:adenosylhomocysteinase
MKQSIVKDPSLASEGRRKIDWVSRNMPILSSIRKDFESTLPFKG